MLAELPPLAVRGAQCSALLIATLVYCVAFVRSAQIGLPRFLRALPALVVFTLIPMALREVRRNKNLNTWFYMWQVSCGCTGGLGTWGPASLFNLAPVQPPHRTPEHLLYPCPVS